MAELIEPELSYEIIGLCMEIHSELGSSCKEQYYQKALESSFKKNKIKYQKEIKVDLKFRDDKIGHYFLDFLVKSRIVIELKAKPFISKSDIKQVLDYLKSANIKLGLLINFGANSLEYERIINSSYKPNLQDKK